MHHPNQRTLDALADALDRAREHDPDGHAASALGQIVRDYRDWLTGTWVPTPTRAAEYFADSVLTARHHLSEAGLAEVAGILVTTNLEHMDRDSVG